MSKLEYRHLQPSDINQFLQLFYEECSESPKLSQLSVNEQALRLAFYSYIEQQGRDVFIRGVFDGTTMIGLFVGCYTFDPIFSISRVQDQITYIRPKYRGNGFILKRILSQYLNWARERGVDNPEISITSEIDSPFEGLLNLLGWEPKQTKTFTYSLKGDE